MLKKIQLIFLMAALGASLRGQSDEVLIAVAANFGEAAKIISGRFQERTGQKVIPVLSSTGKHYAQILNGAPFHAFLAADRERPELLERQGRSVPGSRFTYAVGQLVLWAPEAGARPVGESFLREKKFRYLAMANPKLAPYGEAARALLLRLDLWAQLQGSLIFGENVAQTLQFVESGNAQAGLVAFSQVRAKAWETSSKGLWLIPKDLYPPLEQQAVLLKESAVARAFLDFLKSPEVQELLEGFGYARPPSRVKP